MSNRRETEAILIIEDEPDIRDFATRVLELEGYHVLHAEDGDKGLRLAKENRIILVLLDLRLPRHDGWAVIKEIQSDPELSAIPIVVFTASAGAPQRSRAVAAGVADYLVKPVSTTSLKNTIAFILHQKGRNQRAVKKTVYTGS